MEAEREGVGAQRVGLRVPRAEPAGVEELTRRNRRFTSFISWNLCGWVLINLFGSSIDRVFFGGSNGVGILIGSTAVVICIVANSVLNHCSTCHLHTSAPPCESVGEHDQRSE